MTRKVCIYILSSTTFIVRYNFWKKEKKNFLPVNVAVFFFHLLKRDERFHLPFLGRENAIENKQMNSSINF